MIKFLCPNIKNSQTNMFEQMMLEAIQQAEFDFNVANSFSDAEHKICDIAEQTKKYWKTRTRVDTLEQLVSSSFTEEKWFMRVKDNSLIVSCRFIMTDPLDIDFKNSHSNFLEAITEQVPNNFKCEYMQGNGNKVIGNKLILSKNTDRETGPSGLDSYDTYDVVESLVITKA